MILKNIKVLPTSPINLAQLKVFILQDEVEK